MNGPRGERLSVQAGGKRSARIDPPARATGLAAAIALAGLPLDLHLGGTVMHLGGRGAGLVLFLILAATYLLAGAVLPRAEARLAQTGSSPSL